MGVGRFGRGSCKKEGVWRSEMFDFGDDVRMELIVKRLSYRFWCRGNTLFYFSLECRVWYWGSFRIFSYRDLFEALDSRLRRC